MEPPPIYDIMHKVFNEHDTDGDKHLSRDELLGCMKALFRSQGVLRSGKNISHALENEELRHVMGTTLADANVDFQCFTQIVTREGSGFVTCVSEEEFNRLRQYVHVLMEQRLDTDLIEVKAKHDKPKQKSVRTKADKDRIIRDTQQELDQAEAAEAIAKRAVKEVSRMRESGGDEEQIREAELNAFRQVELAKQQKIEAKAALKYAQDIEIREPPRGRESKF